MVAHPSPRIGLEPLVAEAKHRMRRRRSLVALLIAVTGLTVGLTLAFRSSAPGPGGPLALTSSARAGALRVSVPSRFRSYAVPIGIGARTPVIGRLLTDFRLPAHVDIWSVLGRWSEPGSGPPANGVALKLERWFSPGPVGPGADRLHLPLTVNQPWFHGTLKDGLVGYRWGVLRFHNAEYQVMYWSGPDAPAADRAAILRALESIRPAR